MHDDNLLRILVATDIHLGKHENHPIRGTDSFEAFSEVMQLAKSTKPDFLLLGGDLFDSINPSMKALYSCLRELKDVVFDESEGDDSIQIEVEGCQPNYLNKNLNIRLPIFSVHGNHDYPEDLDGRSVFDLLQESNYINYIGRYRNTESVHVEPILFSKANTRVALYAMGYINTVKLSRLFERNKITFASPPPDSFNILLIHQNRFKGKRPGADYEQCVHPNQLPKWIDLLIWCHQHQSIPVFTKEEDILIYQPGSTVATSIIEAESAVKHIGLLSIRGKKIELEPLFLEKSYRPIFCYQLEMQELIERGKDSELRPEQMLLREVTGLLEESFKNERIKNGKLPLLRVKVERTGFDTVLVKMCEREFDKRVANPSEVFKFWSRKTLRQLPRAEISDEQLLSALKNKTSLMESFTEYETEIIERLRAELKKLNPNRMNEFDAVLENSIVKNTMPEKDAVALATKQTFKKINGVLLSEAEELSSSLDRTWSECHQIIMDKVAPNLKEDGVGSTVQFTRDEEEQINLLKSIDYQEQVKVRLAQAKFQQLYQTSGALRSRFASQEPSQQKAFSHQSSNYIDLEAEDDKCCPPANQVYSKSTTERFEILNDALKKQPIQRKLKPLYEEPPRSKKQSKRKKGKSKPKKADFSEEEYS